MGWALTGALALGGCDLIEPPAAPRCVAVQGEATVPAAQVCARLEGLSCRLPDCAQAYANYQSRVSPAEFSRLTSCYAHATSCAEVGECEMACGADGGMITVAPPTDAAVDAATVDAATDAAADATADVGNDAGVDAGMDVGMDVGNDAGVDVGMDVGTDVGMDVGMDVGNDAGTDVGSDVGADAGADVMKSEAGADAAD